MEAFELGDIELRRRARGALYVEHRFVDITEELAVAVMFAPAEGTAALG